MKIEDFDLQNLHDAVLREISVKWEKRAYAELDLRPNEAYISPSRPIVLKCERLTRLACPQQNPWGPSDCVNGATVKDAVGGARLEIEMQSGDVIVIEGESFDITIKDADDTGT